MALPYVKHKRLLLKSHGEFSEKWLQQQIAVDTSLLGLGELDVKDLERSQPRSGRLDILLFDPETNTRYEVELQLGSTDESHIIRTIEYWDIERRRYPQYDHVGVIVAEKITARFFNVISLFNGFIPLIAIQLNAIEMSDAITLVVHHRARPNDARRRGGGRCRRTTRPFILGNEGFSCDVAGYRQAASALIREVEPGIALKYNKNYIGLSRQGIATNYATFRPRRQHVIAELKVPRSEEINQQLEDAGMNVLTYQVRWGRYRLQLDHEDLEQHADLLRGLIKQAHDNY